MSLIKKLIEQAEGKPEEICISQLLPFNDGPRESKTWTRASFLEETKKLASYLKQVGVKKGERVAIISNSRPEWLIADLAIMYLGGVSVSVYQTLTPKEIAYILYDSEVGVVFAENKEQVDKLNSLGNQTIEIPEVEDRPATSAEIDLKKVICFEEVESSDLVCPLSLILETEQEPVDPEEIAPDDLACFVYTSGTTGIPKGVMQTHANHLANVEQVINSGIIDRDPSIFLFLPLAHSFAKLMAYLGLMANASLKFPSISDTETSQIDPQVINRDLSASNSHIIPIVPRILEKIMLGLKSKAEEDDLQAKLLQLVLKASSTKEQSLTWKIVDKILTPIRKKIVRKIFGKNLFFLVSGGAKLYKETNLFFDNLGICVLQGYGLTETCVATNINRPNNNKIGTVGPVLDHSIEMRISDQGEILFKGPNVTSGYWRRHEATQKSWDADGWFHTGDLGAIDQEGRLMITGRIKEIIVSSYGKKIAPIPIEARLKQSPYVLEAIMFGNDRKYCVALIRINSDQVNQWAERSSITLSNDLTSCEHVRDLIQKEIDRVNSDLAGYEEIKKFALIEEEFTVENGLLTPTMKIRREVVRNEFDIIIEAMF